jgi:hypothetical protein
LGNAWLARRNLADGCRNGVGLLLRVALEVGQIGMRILVAILSAAYRRFDPGLPDGRRWAVDDTTVLPSIVPKDGLKASSEATCYYPIRYDHRCSRRACSLQSRLP